MAAFDPEQPWALPYKLGAIRLSSLQAYVELRESSHKRSSRDHLPTGELRSGSCTAIDVMALYPAQ